MCVRVCVCARVYVCVCVCVCEKASGMSAGVLMVKYPEYFRLLLSAVG